MPSMRRIHIFKAGRQTAMSGQTIDFTEADMAATAAAYDPAKHEAPIVVGHPATDDPAYGWTRSLAAQGTDLFAEPHQVNPEFSEQVKAGAYKKVSASFYPPTHPNNPVPGVYYLRHIGFLGAQPPAVKGLKATEFAEETDCIELQLDFSEEPTAQPAAADPESSSLPPENTHTKGAGGSPEGSTPPPSPSSQESNTVTPEEKAALQAQNAQLKADLDAANSRLRESAQAAKTAEHAAFADALVAETRLPGDRKDLVVAMLNHLEPAVIAGEQTSNVQFGEGEAAKPMGEVFKAFLQGLPKRVEFGEQASRERAAPRQGDGQAVQYAEGTPPEAIELDKKIRAYAVEHKLTYGEAALAVATLPAQV